MPSSPRPILGRHSPFVGALGLSLMVAGLARAEGPRGAEWIASDAAIYVEVTRPADLVARLTGETVRKLVGRPPSSLEGDGFRDGRRAVGAVALALGTTWDRGLLDLAGGGIVFAVEPATPPRAILIVTPRDPAFPPRVRETLHRLARLDALLNKRPGPIAEFDHRGIKADRLGADAAYAIVEGAAVFAESEKTLRAVIDRSLDGPGPARSLADDPEWKARRLAELSGDAAAWGLARLDRVRQIDPKALAIPAEVNPLLTLLFADWIETVRRSPWVAANLSWTDDHLGVSLALPTPPGRYSEAFGRYLPPKGKGAPTPAMPKGTILSVSLWRDLASLWEVRSDLFSPQVVQGFAQLDTFAGTYFGGRDFGTGVLGALGADWRLVVVRQDAAALDPVPDDKLPAFALVADLKPDDEDFAVRLKAAFQSFIGLANLGAAQTKAPPLMLGSEECDGTSISTSRFHRSRGEAREPGPVNDRHNFSPSAVQVGDRFILSSSLGLARDLVAPMKEAGPATDATLLAEADGAELAALIGENRAKMVMRNMVAKGNDRARAEAEVDFLARLARALNRGSLSARDDADGVRFQLDFRIDAP